MSKSGFHIIKVKIAEEKKPKKYGEPYFCRHCGCKLNSYHKDDACLPCQEAGKLGYSRYEIGEVPPKEKIKGILEILRNKKTQGP